MAKKLGPAATHDHPIAVWHRLVQTRDPSGVGALLADEVVFYSPVVHTPQRGRALTALYLSAAFDVFFNQSFRYVREILGPADAVLEFTTVVEGVEVNGIDLIKWNELGKIVEFKVMIRPLKAINLIHQKMASLLELMKNSSKV